MPDNGNATTAPQAENRAVAQPVPVGLRPTDLDALWRMADALARSPLLPDHLIKNSRERFGWEQIKANVFLCLQYGAEVGIAPMQSIQGIYVINNRPCLWGDALIGVVRASGLCEYIDETTEGNVDDRTSLVAYCETKRSDTGEVIKRDYTWKDAEAAKLTNKSDTWGKYPRRMLQMRARSLCLRDAYADVIKGLTVAEELLDHFGPDRAVDVTPPRPTRKGTERFLQAGETDPGNQSPAEPFAELFDQFGETIGKFDTEAAYTVAVMDHLRQSAWDESTLAQFEENNAHAFSELEDKHPAHWSLVDGALSQAANEFETTPSSASESEPDDTDTVPADNAHPPSGAPSSRAEPAGAPSSAVEKPETASDAPFPGDLPEGQRVAAVEEITPEQLIEVLGSAPTKEAVNQTLNQHAQALAGWEKPVRKRVEDAGTQRIKELTK